MMKKELNNNRLEKSIFNSTLLSKVIILILILAIIIILFIPRTFLVSRNFNTKEVQKYWDLKNKKFTVAYTHSVMLSEVTETYKVDDEDIILLESTFQDYGAGLPATTPYDFKIDEDTKLFTIYNINEVIDPLIYRTGAVRANHKVSLDDRSYDFLSFSQPGESVEFKSTNRNYFDLIIKGGFDFDG